MIHKTTIFKYLAIASLVLSLEAKTYNVDELILISLENSPDLQISRANYEASKSRYDSAFSGYLPKIDVNAAAGKIGMSDISTPNSDEIIDDDLLFGQLSLKQIIYDFGKTGANADSFSYQSESYLMQNEQTISNKIRDIKNSYYNVLKSLALITVQKENIKLNEAQLYRSKKYFEAGIRTKIDVSDAKLSLIEAKLALRRAEYDLKSAYATLDQVVGIFTLEKEYSIYSQALDLSSLYASIYNYDLNLKESILYAYKNRAELKKYQADIKAAQAQIDQSSSEYYPAFYFAADYTKQKLDTLASLTPEDQWSATLNLNWNLYQGGATNAQTKEKEILTQVANYNYASTQLNIKKETTDAYINLNKSKDSVELAQSLVEVSKLKFDQASKRYKFGLSDYIELQQARQQYIDAKATLIVDYYDYYIAIAKLDNAIGR